MKKIFTIFIIAMMLFSLCACSTIMQDTYTLPVDTLPTLTIVETTSPANEYGVGIPFEFDKLEIVVGETVEFTTVDNQFSDWYGKDICRVPITIKNLASETHGLNMFYISYYDATAQLDSVEFYFDDSVEQAGDLRVGASYTAYMYFPYTESGSYMIQFATLFGNPIEIEMYISK